MVSKCLMYYTILASRVVHPSPPSVATLCRHLPCVLTFPPVDLRAVCLVRAMVENDVSSFQMRKK